MTKQPSNLPVPRNEPVYDYAPGSGARDALKAVGLLYIVSALGCALCWNLASFCVFRFLGGLAIGASSVLAPVYISEIAPADRRGALTGLFQFNIVFGILLAFLSNALVQQLSGGEDAWRVKLGIAAVPSLLFFMLLYRIPQSPRWLAQRGRRDEARAGLEEVRIIAQHLSLTVLLDAGPNIGVGGARPAPGPYPECGRDRDRALAPQSAKRRSERSPGPARSYSRRALGRGTRFRRACRSRCSDRPGRLRPNNLEGRCSLRVPRRHPA